MKFSKIKYIIFSLLLVAFGLSANAHFGYKGISEVGKVTSSARNSDSSLFIGTSNGGVFQSISPLIDGWVARNVGLTSGKISDLTYSGKYIYAVTEDQGVFRYSGRDGVADRYWEKINTGLTDVSMTSIVAIDTSNLLASTSNGRVFLTVDKGEHWNEVSSSLFVGMNILKLQKTGKRIFVLTEKNGLFKTDNLGQTWVEFNALSTKNTLASNTITYNSTSGELLVANTNGLFVLKNASATANPNYTSLPISFSSKINKLSSSGNAWFVATNNGIYASLTSQINWVQFGLGGLNDTCVNIIPFYTKFIASTSGNGLYLLNSAGSEWTSCNTGLNNIQTIAFTLRGENTIAVASAKGVYVSMDNGNSYVLKNKGLVDSLKLTDITFKNSKLFASSSGGVYISLDTGSTWNLFSKGLTNLNIVTLFSSKKYIYLVNNIGELYRTDGVNSWKLSQVGLNSPLTQTNFSQMNTSVVLTSYNQGVFKRNEIMDSWQNITSNLPSKKVTTLTYYGSKLFVGTEDLGVFVTDTTNINWKLSILNLSPKASLVNLKSTEVLAMNSYRGYVFAAVKGAVYATSNDGISWIDAGTPFNLPSYASLTEFGFTSSRIFVCTPNNFIYSNLLAELPSIINITKINYPICGDSINELGKISVQYTGGYEPYIIKWNTNDSVSTIKGIKPGKYVVTITDKNGAMASDSVELSFKPCHSDTTIVPPIDTTNNVPKDTVKYVVIQDVMTIAPNPAFAKTTIMFTLPNTIHDVRLLDNKGDLIFRREETFISKSFDIENRFESGLYFVEIETDSGVYRHKILFLK